MTMLCLGKTTQFLTTQEVTHLKLLILLFEIHKWLLVLVCALFKLYMI